MTRRAAATLLAALVPAVAAAQSPPVSDANLVRAIEIRRYDIFAPSEATGFLPRLANGLHLTTRERVIRRELLFRAGQPYDSAKVAETARNLRSLGVFRGVSIDSVRTDSGLVVRVTTGDGWSTRPITHVKTTGEDVQFTVGVEELNFLGTATLLSGRYTHGPDRDIATMSFRQPRLLAGRIGLTMQYSHLTDGDLGFVQFSKPFFSLSGRTGWRFGVDSRAHRVLRFFEGATTPGDTLERKFFLAGGVAAYALRAGPGGYLRVGLNGQVRREDYADESRVDTLGRTVTGSVGGYIQWRKARFLVSRGLEGFAREEDVDVSSTVDFGLAATPKAFGYAEDGVASFLVASTGFGQPRGFVQLNGIATARVTGAGLDSGSVHLSSTAFFLPWPRHLAVLHGAIGWQDNAAPGAEFDLGLGLGPRAFRPHAFTGDRAFFTTAEYRWTATDDFLKLTAIGLAGFVDYGGAWYQGSRRRTGWDFGVGLRFGPTRATDVQTSRVDLAYRVGNDAEPGRWILVVGQGFAFSPTGRLDR